MKNTYHFSELDGDGMSAPKGHAGGILPLIKQRMKSAIAAAVPPLSRAQLVDRMNEIAERENLKITVSKGPLTPAILDKWLAPREPDLPPLPAMSVFMQALGDFGLLEALAEFHGFRLLSPEEALFYEFGKAKFEKREQSRRIKRLEESIMENRKRGR